MSLFDKLDRTILRNIQIQHTINHEPRPNPDSIEIGQVSKGGVIKVYGDFNKPDEFKLKIERSILIKEFANLKMSQVNSRVFSPTTSQINSKED